MTFEEAIERYEEITGEHAERPVERHEDGWRFGDRVRVSETDEERGLYANDEGMCVIEMVGSQGNNNERVCLSILVDDEDSTREVQTYDIEPA